MKTSHVIEAYLTARRAQGVKLRSSTRLLKRFARETDDTELDLVTSEAVANFLHGPSQLTTTWGSKRSLLAGLYRFAIARGYATVSPLPERRPKLPPPHPPHVYSTDELQHLLNATETLRVNNSPLRVETYRTLLLILYGAGLRVSEATGLQLRDVDLSQRLLTIRETKFYKTRLVPIGLRLAAAIATYLERRRALPMTEGDEAALLCSRTGHHLWYQDVVTQFQRVRAAAGIGCPPGATRQPRLHDLRHTAAVHRVVAWYREGRDVQRLLPQLATYLGHSEIKSTQRYLSMTPELLNEAGQRFAAYAGMGGDHA
jgi:site-specific recombinase XerD